MTDDGEMTPPTSEGALFQAPFYKDWTVLLGLTATAVSAVSTKREYGNMATFEGSDYLSLAIDLMIVGAVQGMTFAVLPALIRRWVRRARKSTVQRSPLKLRVYWGCAALVAFAASAITADNENSTSSSRGVEQERCEPKGEDVFCIKGRLVSKTSALLNAKWEYSTFRVIDGLEVSSISWDLLIDCQERTGTISNLSAFDDSGVVVAISEPSRLSMINGLQTDQSPRIVASACASM